MLNALMDSSRALKAINKISPAFVWAKYADRCRAAGMTSSRLIVSFDCDIDDDIDVAWSVHERLMSIGVLSAYAVPGAQLEKGAAVYRRIADTGAEFLNHGGRAHTYFDSSLGEHRSCFFYEQQTRQDLEEDIRLGHKIVESVIGVTPTGWRTPHFGSFQDADHFDFLYGLLGEMGYRYSSSAMPVTGLRHGPSIEEKGGITEIPLTGPYDYPFMNMDSWSYFHTHGAKGADAYLESCKNLAKLAENRPVLINIYADPCHIAAHDGFFDGMRILADAATPTGFSQFLQDTK